MKLFLNFIFGLSGLLLPLTSFSSLPKGNIFETKIVLAQTPQDVLYQEAEQLLNQGIEQAKTSQFQDAFLAWKEALRLYREVEIDPLADEKLRNLARQGSANTLEKIGDAYHSLGQYEKAIEYYQQSLLIRQEIQDRRGEAKTLGLLGISYGALGEYDQGIAYPQQALTISQEIGDRLGEAIALSNLGEGYHALGRYDQAIKYQDRSLEIIQEIQTADPGQSEAVSKGKAKALGHLGDTHHSLGKYEDAQEYHEQTLALSQDIGDRKREAKALGQLGKTYHSLEKYQDAIDHHQQSITIHRELGNLWGEGKVLNNLGLTYHSLGQYEEAIEHHQQALVITQEIGARQGESHSLSHLGAAFLSLGKYEQAQKFQQKSLVIAQEIGDRLGEGMILSHLGETYNRLQNYEKSEDSLYQAIEVYESLRKRLRDEQKISIFETQANAYQHLQHALIAQNKIAQALEIAERGRARAFVELLAVRNTSQPENQFIKPLTFADIQQVAKEQNATLVEYSVLPDRNKIYIWVVSPQGLLNFKAVDLDTSLKELVTFTRQKIGIRGRNARGVLVVALAPEVNSQENLQQLHELLIAPIAEFLPTNPRDRVIFVPQRSLFLVPFPALQDAAGNDLIEKHTMLTTPAIQVLQLTRQNQQNRQRLSQRTAKASDATSQNPLIVGNPTMPKVGLPPEQLSDLPGAEAEAKQIANFLGTQPLLGSEATKQTVLAQLSQAKLVHIATHGLLDDFGYDTPGAIALAPTEEDNGLLTAGEIMNLDLNADLVVLSACDTGKGDIRGDGVVGLSRSLLTAGASSVVVSLWAVPDEPTAALMQEFYRLLAQDLDKAQALREAMLNIKDLYPDPVNWAAFTLIGEAEQPLRGD